MTLFLDGIFNEGNKSPSAVTVDFPIVYPGSNDSNDRITGLLISEPTMSTSINWGPIINDLSNIQDISSLIGASQMWTWIGASAMCWKGTAPLTTSIEFYLINYKRGLYLEEKLKNLNLLTSLTRKNGDEKIAVQVHGGYTAPVLQSNTDYFNNNMEKESIVSGLEQFGKDYIYNSNKNLNMAKGTLTITFGRKMKITHMLVKRLDVTPSVVEVPDGKPLYYRVSMSLTGSRPLLSVDVENMYKGVK